MLCFLTGTNEMVRVGVYEPNVSRQRPAGFVTNALGAQLRRRGALFLLTIFPDIFSDLVSSHSHWISNRELHRAADVVLGELDVL